MFGQQQPGIRGSQAKAGEMQFNGASPSLDNYKKGLEKDLENIINAIVLIDPNTTNPEQKIKLEQLIAKRDRLAADIRKLS